MALALYRLLLYALAPVIFARLWWRGRRAPGYRQRWPERLGVLSPEKAASVRGGFWFHTVSAGETIAAAPVIRRLHERRPAVPILITTMTPTGAEQAQRLLSDIAVHAYAPYDFPGAVGRFLRAVQPRFCAVMETELWPNWLRALEQRNTPALLVNARLSERSADGYQRVSALTRPMLQRLHTVACQYPAHAQRFAALGVAEQRLSVLGSVKFDVEVPTDAAERCRAWRQDFQLGERPVWIAASTHEGEEAVALEAHQRIRQVVPEAVLILVPRHPERFDAVAGLAGQDSIRLSQGIAQNPPSVIVADTMGQLLHLYGLSLAAFIGGSLIERGGHNPVEAAVHGQCLLMGPHRFNFAEVSRYFEEGGALFAVDSADAIAAEVIRCVRAPETAQQRADAARAVVAANGGATERLVALLDRFAVAVSPQ